MINEKRLLELTCSLIDIYSPSGKEQEAVNFLSNYLGHAGIYPIRQAVEAGRDNLLILVDKSQNSILFMGHIDTVPASNLQNFQSEIQHDKIYGLGAADMKAGCAAMIEALLCYQDKYQRLPPVSLAFVVGEEETGDGAIKLCEEYHFEWAVVGEPTSLNLAHSHFGYLEMDIITRGEKKHASLAGSSKNAVHTMLGALNEITGFLDQRYPFCVYNLRDINSSAQGFVVAEKCEACVDIHIPPGLSVQEVLENLSSMIRELSHKNTFIEDILFDFPVIHSGYVLEQSERILRLFGDRKADSEYSFPSDSDGVILYKNGVKPLILGPGSLSEAHTSGEFVNISEITEASRIYFNFMEQLGSADTSG